MKALREILGTKPLKIDVPTSPQEDEQARKEKEFIAHMTGGAVSYDLPWEKTDYLSGIRQTVPEGPDAGLKEPLEKLKEAISEAIETLDEDEFDVFIEELDLDSLDEISKQKLGDYINKAHQSGKDAAYEEGSDHWDDEAVEDSHKTQAKRAVGIRRAVKRLTKEDVDQVDEISRDTLKRYIKRTEDDPKREKGRKLALKKNWGDKRYGLPEPKVKATPVAEEVTEQVVEKPKRLADYKESGSLREADQGLYR